MVQITQKAAEKWNELLCTQNRSNVVMRVAVMGGDCAGLKYFIGMDDFRGVDDFEIDCEGTILRIDQTSLNYLWGAQIDWIELENEAGFAILENPNKGRGKSGCGSNGKGCMSIGDGKTCQNKSGGSCGSSCGGSCSSKGEKELHHIEFVA